MLSKSLRYAGWPKRAIDIALAACAVVALAPLMVIICAVVRTTMGAPVLFRQARIGRNGRTFVIYKFRTMAFPSGTHDADLSDAARLTRAGRLLRTTSLDELPELWNVLRGEMSLVGPRPLLVEYVPRYTPEQARRHEVTPGITGWAQVNGRNELAWKRKFELDVWYVDHVSLGLDLKVLWRTVAAVLSRRGTSAPGEATMPPFLGTLEQDSQESGGLK